MPAIISHSLSEYYQIGDAIQLHGKREGYILKIIGILDRHDFFMSFRSAGDFMCINEIFEKGNVIICPESSKLIEDRLVGCFILMCKGI
jgi:hypothetical protein